MKLAIRLTLLSWFLAFGPHKALNVLTAVFWVVALTHVSKERIVSIIRVTILCLLLAQAI
jgi:branched-subunit amino acid transport protein AzlD